jgi:hypothetical protein
MARKTIKEAALEAYVKAGEAAADRVIESALGKKKRKTVKLVGDYLAVSYAGEGVLELLVDVEGKLHEIRIQWPGSQRDEVDDLQEAADQLHMDTQDLIDSCSWECPGCSELVDEPEPDAKEDYLCKKCRNELSNENVSGPS